MANYFNSSNVTVFPSTKRSKYDIEARNLTEYNLSRLTNTLLDSDGFIIDYTLNNDDVIDEISFNIHGYIFTLTGVSNFLSSYVGDDLVASIKIANVNVTIGEQVGFQNAFKELSVISSSNVSELSDLDNGDTFKGLYLSITNDVPDADGNSSIYSLKLLTKDDNVWHINESSFVMFSQNRLPKFIIDGGEIS